MVIYTSLLSALRYDGENIGQYLNQGGLRQALSLMVRLCRQPGPFQFSLIEDKAQAHCNTCFSYHKHAGAVVIAEERIELREEPVELLVNYGIEDYWLGFFGRHALDWGLEHPMVRSVLWCASSPHSSLDDHLKQVVLRALPQGVTVPPNITPP